MGSSRRTVARVLVVASLAAAAWGSVHALPSGFTEETVAGGWNAVVGITFAANGDMYGWEKSGRVWIVHPDGTKHSTPLIDISEEVGNWRDYGLLGFALDPNFLANGYIYLLYVVDRHHLLYHGTGSYDPDANEYFGATIGRVTRYTADAADGLESVLPGSRLVLVGESASTGFPIVHQSHGVGSLAFGTDGTLFATCGDGASYESVDNGGSAGNAYGPQALADGIIAPKEDVGAFRAQLVDSLSGKIIRIDPATGDGLPSNPYFDAAAPRAARSRVWSMGHRNPYRMTFRPGTGQHDPAAGDPGVIYVGDVGWNTWEDIDVVTGPGQNMGWPIFEGMTRVQSYYDAKTANLDTPNPLYGVADCTQQYFDFQDLLVQDDLAPAWPNPCDAAQQVPAADRRVHHRPAIDYRHGSGPARAGIYDAGGHAVTIDIDDPSSPVTGDRFGGNASTGGVWYTGTSYPEEYRGRYFHGDYGSNWIRTFEFDGTEAPVAVHRFVDSGRHPVAFATDPISGDVFYVDYGSQVIRLRYVGAGNLPPTAIAAAERDHGTGPLEVRFFGDGSTDPEDEPLDYAWDFADGGTATEQNPIHTFVATGPGPSIFDVQLTVTDSFGETSSDAVRVVLDDTPPSVTLTNPVDGATYTMVEEAPLDVESDVTDFEDPPGSWFCRTQVFLHHNDHVHPEPEVYDCTAATMTSPIGCEGILYYYRATVSVTDSSGLRSRDEANVYPDCAGVTLVADAGPDLVVTDPTRDGGETVTLDGTASFDPSQTIVSYSWRLDDQPFASGPTTTQRLPIGTSVVTLVVANDIGDLAVDTVRVTVEPGDGSLAVPEARFRMTPEGGVPPLAVSFDASESSDPDGDVVSWSWAFGDGGTAEGPAPTHAFLSPGSHDVVLTVTDDDGLQDTITHVVRVRDAAMVLLLAMDEDSGGSTIDASGLGNDGTLAGGAGWTAGFLASAVGLDGIDGRIEIPAATSLDLRNRLTLAAWVRRDAPGAGGGIVVRGETAVPYGLGVEPDGRLRFTANAEAPGGGSGGGSWTSTGAVGTGTWHHAAVTYDGERIRFFLDGALDPNQPAADLVFGRVAEPLFVGASPYDGAFLEGAIDDARIHNVALSPSEIDDLGSGLGGLDYRYYEGTWDLLPDFDLLPVVESGAVRNVTLAVRNQDDNFGVRLEGCLDVPVDGSYTLFTTSDDGSKLYLDGAPVVDNDGLHGPRERSGTVTLSAGLHPLVITFFEKGGGEVLEARWQGPGIAKQLLPDGALFRDGCSGGANRRPVAVDDLAEVAVGGQVIVAVLDNDTDADLEPLQVIRLDPALHGSVTTDGTTVTYVHDGSMDLVDSFAYKIDDGHGATAFGTVDIRACGSSDPTCDGFDDDCDGLIDEDGAVPGEATDLGFGADPMRATMTWIAPASSGGSPQLWYDVVRSSDPSDFAAAGTCIETDDGADTTAYDPSEPVPGGLFGYLVRAGNLCGEGSAGDDSAGGPRTVSVCP